MNGNHVAQWLEGLTEKNTVILKNECILPENNGKIFRYCLDTTPFLVA